MLSLNCEVCGSKNSRFIKEQQRKRLLGNLTGSFNKIPVFL